MVLRREITAVADVLSADGNAERTAEDVAELAIQALDEIRSRTHRLAVIANYRWHATEEPTLAMIGPFGTRATAAARNMGSAMAGTARGGGGKWMLIPAYANARVAWDAISPPSKEERKLAEFLESIKRSTDNPSVWDGLSIPGSAAQCCCGVRSGSWCEKHRKRNP